MFYREELIFKSGGESNYRIPNLVVTKSGTVLAFCNDRKGTLADHATDTVLVCARKEAGKPWETPSVLMEYKGICCLIGCAVYDGIEDQTILFVNRKVARDEFANLSLEEIERLTLEDQRRFAALGIELGHVQGVSFDDGKNWCFEKVNQEPLAFTHTDGRKFSVPMSTHGGAHGVQLRHGKYAGRLICPSRIFAGRYQSWDEIHKYVYNNAVYSDDHGKTWKVSEPVQLGTGEGCLAELENGDILYNSRAYFGDGKRYLAISRDGGQSYEDQGTDPFLLEETRIGCNASLLRVDREELGEELASRFLPNEAKSVMIFVNPRAERRRNMTACISFDEGKSWRVAKTIFEGPCAYSSLDFSPVDQHFYLIYEKGSERPYTLGISAVEFDLEWLLG